MSPSQALAVQPGAPSLKGNAANPTPKGDISALPTAARTRTESDDLKSERDSQKGRTSATNSLKAASSSNRNRSNRRGSRQPAASSSSVAPAPSETKLSSSDAGGKSTTEAAASPAAPAAGSTSPVLVSDMQGKSVHRENAVSIVVVGIHEKAAEQPPHHHHASGHESTRRKRDKPERPFPCHLLSTLASFSASVSVCFALAGVVVCVHALLAGLFVSPLSGGLVCGAAEVEPTTDELAQEILRDTADLAHSATDTMRNKQKERQRQEEEAREKRDKAERRKHKEKEKEKEHKEKEKERDKDKDSARSRKDKDSRDKKEKDKDRDRDKDHERETYLDSFRRKAASKAEDEAFLTESARMRQRKLDSRGGDEDDSGAHSARNFVGLWSGN